MRRRLFLKSVAAGLALFPRGGLASVTQKLPAQTVPVVTDINEDVSIPHLIAVIDAFVDQNIPLACVVNPFDKQGRPHTAKSKLAQVLNGYLIGRSGLDVVPYVPELQSLSEHFQARAAHDAVSAMQRMLWSGGSARQPAKVLQAIACADQEDPAAPRGVRSAGILNLLSVPAKSAPVRTETWDNGVVRLFGGNLLSLNDFDGTAQTVAASASQNIVYFSAKDFSGMDVKKLKAAAIWFASALSQQELDGDVSLLPVTDIQLRDTYGFKRTVCLHVLKPQENDHDQLSGYSGFTKFLQAAGIPYSTGNQFAGEANNGFWVPTDFHPKNAEASAAQHIMLPVEIESRSEAKIRTVRPLGPGIGVAFIAETGGVQGLEGAGFLQFPQRVVSDGGAAEAFESATAGTRDVVVFIQPEAIAFPPERRALETLLKDMLRDEETKFLLLEEFARTVAPAGPLPTRWRRTAAAAPELARTRQNLSDAKRQELLEDARVAWQYFENFTDPRTGLCPATVDFAPGGRKHEAVTMWDVGSHINGLVAAVQIGFISQPDFETAIRKILPNITGRTFMGRHLPQGWIRTDRRKWGNRDFDGSDAGRLLAALDNLRRHSSFGEQLAKLVASWDLRKVIIEGEIHSVTSGELETSYVSHSAHYSALAFRRWGIAAKSPYEVFSGRSAADGQMALLEAAAKIGPFGAEPLLLEAMEMGMSKESAYLADVLFAAQLEDFRETGRLICVSEGPIDKSPWFLYQGLQLDAKKRTWAFDTVGQEPEYRTPEFREENLVISSKAAFLWSAYQPHEYSEKLYRFTRSAAKTKNGFASSIYLKTGRTTETYSDLNTNGVILQAIAHRLARSN
ncbi:twin-arginine translocation pathway signal [Leisingera sp. ANG-M6]|nr:twin-arginine translocation pathway signal [Leisingera sp. ANG-M6]